MTQAAMNIGPVSVITTQGRGHTPEEVAQRCLDKLMYVSKDAPEVIRQQAEAYRAHMYYVLVQYMHEAVKSDRTTLYAELTKQGHADMAELIRRL
jgi:hypothetical protein